MGAKEKQLIKFLLFKWKSLIPYAAIQRTFLENYLINKETPHPFDFSHFNPIVEIDILQDKIINCSNKFKWIKQNCELPQNLCDDDWAEIYARYNYMIIEKIKKIVYKH